MIRTREEFQNKCKVRRFNIGDTVITFDCNDEDLNDFLLNEANLYRNALLSVTYVVENRDTDEVLAYFSLSNDKISISDFESKTEFNRFRKHKFVNEKRLRSYPAIKIGRLAIAKPAQHQSIGTYLLEFIEDYFIINSIALAVVVRLQLLWVCNPRWFRYL